MRYDEFLRSWRSALAASELPTGLSEHERIELDGMGRTYEVIVEPFGGQRTEPFFVTATLSFNWGALQEARGRTCEEDVMRDLIDSEVALPSEPRRLRIDIALHATLSVGRAEPIPSRERLARWTHETTARLESVERLLPAEEASEDERGRLAILAWKGDPKVSASCGADGALRLERVDLAAWQAIGLPRVWDHPDREEDPRPDDELARMFKRVKAALYAWMEALDHLGVAEGDRRR